MKRRRFVCPPEFHAIELKQAPHKSTEDYGSSQSCFTRPGA